MQQSLSIEPLPQFASQSLLTESSHQPSTSGSSPPLCGAFDPLTCFLVLGDASGTVSCLHMGRYGSAARRVLGRHAGRVTAACLFPWQPPPHIAAAATVMPCAPTASFFATCSADATIKLWTSDAKALHTTDACLQTLQGHRAAVTSLAAVQVSHTWCLLSGGTDGQLLLWRAESPAEAGDQQQLSGAAMLAQLVPHMRLTEAALHSSPHWVQGIACPAQQTEAGVNQGAFVALAQQPLLQVPISRSAVSDAAAGLAPSAQQQQRQQQYRSSTPTCSRSVPQSHLQPSQLGAATSPAPAATQCSSRFAPSVTLCATGAGSSTNAAKQNLPASSAACSSPTTSSARQHLAQRLQRPGSASSTTTSSSSFTSSSCCSPAVVFRAAPAVREVQGTQHLSMLAVKYVPQQLAVMTLAYDGACRLHSVAEGATRCCWRSPTGSNYTAVDVCTGPEGQVVLLGDDRGSLHLYSLVSEKMLASKQLSSSRITALISCEAAPGTAHSNSPAGISGAGASSGSSRGGTCVQFAALSENGVGLWQLRQGFGHGIVPGGHRQAVLVLQYCSGGTFTQEAAPHAAACALTKPGSSWRSQPTFCGLSGQQPSDTYSAHDTPGSRDAGGCGSNGGLRSSTDGGGSSSGGGSSGGGSSCSGPMLMSAGLDGRVIQWDLSGGGPAAVQSVLASAAADAGSELSAMTHLQGASILATGHHNGQILLWHMDTGSHTVLGPQAHTNSVASLAAATTAKGDEQLVSGGFDGWVCLWEPRQVRGIKPHLIARFQANGCRPGSPPRTLHLPQQQQQQQHIPPKPAAAASGSTSSSGRPVSGSRAASAFLGWGVGREQHVWPSSAAQHVDSTRPGSSSSSSSRVKQRPGAAGSFSRQPGTGASSSSSQAPTSSQQLAAGGAGDSSAGASHGSRCMAQAVDVLAAVQESPREVLVVLFDPLNQVIITGGNDGLVKVWSGGASGQLLGQHVGHTGAPVNCLALDGNLLFSGSHDTTILMWDVLPPWFGSQGCVSHPASSPAALVAAGTTASPAAGSCGGTAANSQGSCSPAGSRIVAAASCRESPGTTASSSTGRSASSQPASSTAFAVLIGHSAAVTGLAVAADSGVLVSCGADGQVLQWDYCSGQVLARYRLESHSLCGLAVQPDTRLVFVGTSHGQLLTLPGTEQVVGAHSSTARCMAL